jgi:hypothetical protein
MLPSLYHALFSSAWVTLPLFKMEVAASSEMLVPIYQHTWFHIPGDHIGTCWLKAGIVERIGAVIARQRHDKHISASMNQHTTIEELMIIFWEITPCGFPEYDHHSHRHGNLKS